MRLIDADTLKDGYMNMGYDPNEHPEGSYMEGWCKGFNAAVDHCIGHVIYATTIEERKKGKWVGAIEYCKHLEETTGERYQPSSLAGMIYCNQCWKASDRRSNYCRECGSYNWEGGDHI